MKSLRIRRPRVRSVLAAVVMVASIASGAAIAAAHQTQQYPSAICQSGEVCLWPSDAAYDAYYDDVSDATHSSYSGSDASFTGNYAWGVPVVQNDTVTVVRNRGNFCIVYLRSNTNFGGSTYTLNLGVTKNPLPGVHNNTMSSHHWCSSS